MTVEERVAALEQRNQDLEAEVTRLRAAEDARQRAAAPPKPTLPAAAFGSDNPNLGASYSGPPSVPQVGGSISFGLSSRTPIDGVKRDSEGNIIVNKPAEAAPLPHRTPLHQRAVELIDEMLPLKGAGK